MRDVGFAVALLAAIELTGSTLLGQRPTALTGPGATALLQAENLANARLRQVVETKNTPGVSAAVALDGKVIWSGVAGHANLEHAVPVTDATRFGLGSISKTFTVAAMLALVDERRLELDVPIERYLPDWPHKGRGVTLRRLAAHQSGSSDAFAVENNWTSEHFDSIDSAYQRIKLDPLSAEPGTVVSYATGTYTTIAKAMEVVTGRTYWDVMETRLLSRLGATAISLNNRRAIVPHRTGFYVQAETGLFEHGPHYDPSFKVPGAGLLGTARDVALFGSKLLSGEILSAASQREMFTAVATVDGASTEYALGLRVGEHRGRKMLHLPGGGIGISTWIFLYPTERLAIAVLSNVPTGAVGGKTHDVVASAFLAAVQQD